MKWNQIVHSQIEFNLELAFYGIVNIQSIMNYLSNDKKNFYLTLF